ncbi:MAG: threonylcarbamoyl-AMP synthase, partial [Desulfobacterales bacterium]|nr:threonylcarbamoyl-AMP synthase [Desulfobacterales bacterium]
MNRSSADMVGSSGLISIQEAAQQIRNGGLVGFPTETVYGLGCDAFNRSAVQSLFTAKSRPLSNPLIVHVSAVRQIEWLVRRLPKAAEALMEELWPGPLTIVLPKSEYVPSNVTAGGDTVGIRMPA